MLKQWKKMLKKTNVKKKRKDIIKYIHDKEKKKCWKIKYMLKNKARVKKRKEKFKNIKGTC